MTDWYEEYDEGDLVQGDIFTNVLVPNIASLSVESTAQLEEREASVILLTQSCDIPDSETVLAAELYDYQSLFDSQDHFRAKAFRKRLTRGEVLHFFLLPPGGDMPWSVVAFRELHVLPTSLLQEWASRGQIQRMKSPNREYLGQAFGRFIMRVALDEPLDDFMTIEWSPSTS